jgi:adenosylcobinamide-phosphate synthase
MYLESLLADQPAMTIILTAVALNLLICRETVMNRTFRSPLALTGRLIDTLERRYNRPELTEGMRRADGVSTMVALVVTALSAAMMIHWTLLFIPGGWLGEAFILGMMLLLRTYLDQSRILADSVDRSIQESRATLALISGRETDMLDEAGVARGGVEHSARIFSEGIVAPIFYFWLFGLPGLLLVKMVTTASFMIDEKSAYGADFGWAAARLNDILLYPANRIAALLLVLGAFITGGAAPGAAAKALVGDHSGFTMGRLCWPVATMAGALGLSVAGQIFKQCDPEHTAWVGGGSRFADSTHVRSARKLVVYSGALLLAIVTAYMALGFPSPSDYF